MKKPQQESTKVMIECDHEIDGRNLVVSIDGTSNQFGKKNTNVIELYNLILKEEEHNQLTWYNSGIGTYARPSWKSIDYYKQVLYHKVDLAIAWNFEKTVLEAYRWLSDNYRKGDCIFLFGFSRGAFQVRVLSAMIHKVGLIHKGNEAQIPFAYELYADPKSDELEVEVTEVGESGGEKMSMAERFKRAFSQKGVKVHFVGAWDTVSSIGIARGQKLLPYTIEGMKHVCYFRHALALDERRVKFLPEYAYGGTTTATDSKETRERMNAKPSDAKSRATEQDNVATNPEKGGSMKDRPQVKEVWFAGTHSDIGGGNVENPAMNRSRPPLRWMVFEAEAVGLRTAGFKGELSSLEMIEIKESLTWHWWPLEVLPLRRLTFTREETGTKETIKPHLGRKRKIQPGQKIHASLVLAQPKRKYMPKALPAKQMVNFWEKIDIEWLEVDVYDFIEKTVNTFLEEKAPTARQPLGKVDIAGLGRQALYDKVVNTCRVSKIDLEIRCQLLAYSVDILKARSSAQPLLRMIKSVEVREILKSGKENNENYNGNKIKEFIKGFTDHCVYTINSYEGIVSSVAFSPDGQHIVSGAYDGTVRFWDVRKGEEVQIFRGHTDNVNSVAFSPDGNWVISGSDDRTVWVWDVKMRMADGTILRGHTNWVTSVAFSPDSKWVVSGSSDKTVRLWNLENGEAEGKTFEGCTGSVHSTIRLWNVESGKAEGDPFEGHTSWVLSVAFSPDGKHIASGHADEVNSVAFSPDGKCIVSGSSDRTVRLWNVKTGEANGPPLEGHAGWVISVAFSPDGKHVASGSQDRTIRIWDVED
ncbi:WD40-repeat-containing domain protein [Gymnopilus junonius]|uniref:WD40-repeat-containing domain protein n=1 Tax=Gymnopilus junonius TaxID=109634 RepID=A0A9P5NRH5_GYMJU|nr:WD40-repeat-containing domain protein [Gymnopilus junonius]